MELGTKIGSIENEIGHLTKTMDQLAKSQDQLAKSHAQMMNTLDQHSISLEKLTQSQAQMMNTQAQHSASLGLLSTAQVEQAKSLKTVTENIQGLKSAVGTMKWFVSIALTVVATALCILFTMVYGLKGTFNQKDDTLATLQAIQSSLAVIAAPARQAPAPPAETSAPAIADNAPEGHGEGEGIR
jgi:uncharacterized protein (DUF3084 family)